MKTFVWVFLLLVSGCKQDYTITRNPAVQGSTDSGSGGPGGGTPTPTPPTGTTKVFRTLKPAVATRATACMMCHANIRSNFITDFGYGDPYFLDPSGGSDAGASMYFNYVLTTWQGASITGSVIVPKARLDHTTRQINTVDPGSKFDSLSLAEFIQKPVVADLDKNPMNQPAMTVGVSPPDGKKVIEKSKVYIGAPLESEILGLAPDLSIRAVGFVSIKVDGMTYDPKKPLSGLIVVDNKYVTNKASDAFVCAGDVVIKGPLFLQNASIVTDDQGCRLYVSGGVFIQGPITFLGMTASDTKNLQITSSRAIMMGFDPTSVGRRLSLSGDRAWFLTWYFTRGAGSNHDKNQAILDDANKLTGMTDAADAATTYSRMLLNAPQVHSRYTGEFKGALVGEIVMFRLGTFSFSFDPALETVPVLPALTTDILKIED